MPQMKQYHVDVDLQTAGRLELMRKNSGYGHGFISSFLRRAIKTQLNLEEKHGRAVVEPSISSSSETPGLSELARCLSKGEAIKINSREEESPESNPGLSIPKSQDSHSL